MTKTFHTITPEQCLAFYPVVLDNAARHLRIANLLSDHQEYGNAVSHLILGAEELLKGTVLFMDGKGFNLRSKKGIGKLFYNHQARHTVFKKFFSVWLVIQPIMKKKPDVKKKSGWLSQLAIMAASTTLGLLNYHWWDNADALKQKGFYVDFQNSVINPADITEMDFRRALRHAKELNTEVQYFIGELNKLKAKELDDIKQLFAEADLLNLIHEDILEK